MDKGLGAESQRGKVSAFHLVTRVSRRWTVSTATTKDVTLSRMAAKSDRDQISTCTAGLVLLPDVNVCKERLSARNPITHTHTKTMPLSGQRSLNDRERKSNHKADIN